MPETNTPGEVIASTIDDVNCASFLLNKIVTFFCFNWKTNCRMV
jgi:hypothetical protein